MTQAEAVKRLKEWLPEEAYFLAERPVSKGKSVHEVWLNVDSFFSEITEHKNGSRTYHFSQVHCCENKQVFNSLNCLCIKIARNSHIKSFTQHLPYQGECRTEK